MEVYQKTQDSWFRLTVTFATQFRKYNLNQLTKDPNYQAWLNMNECKFWDKDKKFGYFHFFYDALDLKYQVMREVDDFIYIPVKEETYDGETINQLIQKL